MHSNPKAGQGDGAGFGRLRAAQVMREYFTKEIQRSHPSAAVYIDKVHEYAGAQIVLFRIQTSTFHHARVAVFNKDIDGSWHKTNDIIASQA